MLCPPHRRSTPYQMDSLSLEHPHYAMRTRLAFHSRCQVIHFATSLRYRLANYLPPRLHWFIADFDPAAPHFLHHDLLSIYPNLLRMYFHP